MDTQKLSDVYFNLQQQLRDLGSSRVLDAYQYVPGPKAKLVPCDWEKSDAEWVVCADEVFPRLRDDLLDRREHFTTLPSGLMIVKRSFIETLKSKDVLRVPIVYDKYILVVVMLRGRTIWSSKTQGSDGTNSNKTDASSVTQS